VISTCNRVELVNHTTNGAATMRVFCVKLSGKGGRTGSTSLRVPREDAVRHVFAWPRALDSMVVGEAQILGQVKEAYATPVPSARCVLS